MRGPANHDIRRQLQRLVRLQPGKHFIVSCYLKLEPRDRSRGKYQIKLKNRIRGVVEALPAGGLTRSESEQVISDLRRIQDLLQRPDGLPPTQGLAVFASQPLGLFEVIPLPRVHRSRLLVDRTPLVGELAALEDEVGRLLAVVVDKSGASFYEVTAFDARKLEELDAGGVRKGGRFHTSRHGAPGRGEHAFHNRLRHDRERLLDAVAEKLFDLERRSPVRGIVLAGPASETEAVRMFLHPYAAAKLLGTARLARKGLPPRAVHAAVLEAREAFERKLERHLVAEMLLGRGSGWAVNGIGATLAALAKGQVRTLLVRADASVPGFRCGSAGLLTLHPKDCGGLGDPVPVPDVIDDAIEDALRQRVDLDVVFEPDAAEAIDGLAALLRFR